MELQEDKEKRECIYSNNIWMVIRRVTDGGTFFSLVRKYATHFECTFNTLMDAIDFADNTD